MSDTRYVAITTDDNPYNPFTQFSEWYKYDKEVLGYNTSEYLARITKIFEGMSEVEIERETERAIDEIIKYDFLNIYKKIFRDEINT